MDHIDTPPEKTLRELKDAYESGDREAFDMQLDDVATDFLSANSPDFLKNIQEMRRTTNETTQQQIKKRQLALYKEAKEIVAELADLPPQASLSDIEDAKARIQDKMGRTYEADPDNFDPLTSLGILSFDEANQERFTYPRGLFPQSTDAKWQRYLDAVAQHKKAVNSLARGTASKDDVVHADRDRRIAHNSIARDVKYLLSFPGDDIEEPRRLVVKMRESRFPNVDTSEKARTNTALRVGSTVIKGLREHLLSDHEVYYDPEDHL